MFKAINDDEKRSFYCFDQADDLELYGDLSKDSSHLEFFLVPCNYLFTEGDYVGDSVAEECIWDL